MRDYDAPVGGTPNVREALLNAMEDIGVVQKNETNDEQRFSFRGIDAVINAVSPAFRKHRILITQDLANVDYVVVETVAGSFQNATRVVVRYTFTGPDGDSVTACVPGEAYDSGDKATSKAMSVALRTALLQTLMLPTDERDPDASTYEATPDPARHFLPKDPDDVIDQGDPSAALFAAIAAATTTEEMKTLYTELNVKSAPAEVRKRFSSRARALRDAAVQTDETLESAEAVEVSA
jgi:hypothetical protein